jgi:thiol-disulfide isomerase/thioredoxin
MKYVIIFCLLLLPSAAFADIHWKTNLNAAKAESAKTGRPLFVDFHATWCGPCHQMEQDTFQNAKVEAILNKMVCVEIDVDQDQVSAKAYQVDAIPRTLVIPPGTATPIMDTTGYQGPDDYIQELSKALNLKITPSNASGFDDNPDLAQVRAALSSNTYTTLKSKNPKLAASGINQLVVQLGVFEEPQIGPTIVLLSNAGNDAVAPLIAGMDNKVLAIRAGSYRALQTILGSHHMQPNLPYDAWANAKKRHVQVQMWAAWWQSKSKHV